MIDGIGKNSNGKESYIGEWKAGLEHGKGINTMEDGTVQKGMFIAGQFKAAVDFDEDFLMNSVIPDLL
jgi:hypothetical protein